MLQTSLNVYSLKLYHSCVKASSIDFSPLSIISARRSARSFANGCEKHLLRTLDFLTQSENPDENENMLQTSLNVYSLKLYHSCVKASSIDFSPLSIISARRSARSFANGCEKHLLRTLDFLTQSEK
ncbi:hypothetical protein F2Q68_00034605 [Brassica cretica]|uniref:Uncharacterized protein n=1 Tax=Brassica cretica TaxID=69181 RepID=A0A8S9H6D9_BRACR|nr:hypothetical protein F2Q68_00034605 [Brassica cretica]